MPKLNQIIALANGTKSRTQASVTELYHKLQNYPLQAGIERTYTPKDDDGDKYPPESNRVQVRAWDVLREAKDLWVKLFDLVATQDVTNCQATADVAVDGKVLFNASPVTHLLFLEKQLVDIRSFVGKLPTLDPAYDWTFREEANCYVAEPVETTKTKKVMRNHVKAAATDKHPAQVEVYTEDLVVGTWTKRDFSGAVPVTAKNKTLNRITLLLDAVKTAREEANSIEVHQVEYANNLLEYIFDNTAS